MAVQWLSSYSRPKLRPFVPPRGSSLEAYGKARRGNATEVSSEPLEFEGDEEGGREEAVIEDGPRALRSAGLDDASGVSAPTRS